MADFKIHCFFNNEQEGLLDLKRVLKGDFASTMQERSSHGTRTHRKDIRIHERSIGAVKMFFKKIIFAPQ